MSQDLAGFSARYSSAAESRWRTGGRRIIAGSRSRTPEAASCRCRDDQPKKTDFATGADAKDEPKPVKFDTERAMKYLKQLCDIGPRISASEGMKKQQEMIEKHFKDLGATVTRQEFKAQPAEPQSRHARW